MENSSLSHLSAPNLNDFLNSNNKNGGRTITKKAKKKKDSILNRNPILPPMDFVLRTATAEKKLEELERLATTQGNTLLNREGLRSGSSISFGGEQEFSGGRFSTEPSIQSTLSMTLKRSNLVAVHPPAPSSSIPSMDLLLLKQKDKDAKEQMKALREKIQKQEFDLVASSERLRSLTHELEKSKREREMEVKQLINQHEIETLTLKDLHAKEKASILLLQNSNNNNKQQQHHSSSSSADQGQQQQQSDSLEQVTHQYRLELQRLQEQSNRDRQRLINEHFTKLQQQESRSQQELNDLKYRTVKLEDELSNAREENQSIRAELVVVQSRYQHAETMRQQTVEEQGKLRANLKSMQQSIQASYRLEHTSSSSTVLPGSPGSSKSMAASQVNQLLQRGNLPPDIETALRLHDATYEAKLKQYQNKMDFLKMQVETEKKSAEEAKQALQETQQLQDQLREEQKRKLQELEYLQERKLQEREEQVVRSYEHRMNDLTLLQRQLASLQAQQEQKNYEEISYKEREKTWQDSYERIQVTNLALKEENQALRQTISQLEAQREQEQRKDTQKINQEAVLRRLDNERHYLKNQLTAEIALKNEVNQVLASTQKQLTAVQSQWHSDVDALKEGNERLKQEQQHYQQQSSAWQSQHTAEHDHLQENHRQLKEAFMKMRDQLRMEQNALENSQAEKNRLRETIQQLSEEIHREKEQRQQSAKEQAETVNGYQQKLFDLEAYLQKETNRLKDELARQFVDNSTMQVTLLKNKQGMTLENKKVNKILQASRLVESLRRWQNNRIANAWRSWAMNHTLGHVATQFKVQVETLLKTSKQELTLQHEQQLVRQQEEARQAQAVALEQLQAELQAQYDENKETLLLQYQREKEMMESQYQANFQQMEADAKFDLEKQQQNFRDELFQRDEFMKDREQLLMAERGKAMETMRQKLSTQQEEAIAKKEQEMLTWHEEEVSKAKLKMEQAMKKLQQQYEVELDYRIHQLEDDQKKLVKQQEEKHYSLLQGKEDEKTALAKRYEQLLVEKELATKEATRSQCQVEQTQALREQRAELYEAQEERIRSLRQEWQAEFEKRLTEEQEKMNIAFQGKTQELVKDIDQEKNKAVKMESVKWKGVLRDTERRVELEATRLKQEALEEADKAFEKHKKDLLSTFELEKIKLREEYTIEKNNLLLQFEQSKESFIEEEMKILQQKMQEFTVQKEQELFTILQAKFTKQLTEKEAEFASILQQEKDKFEKLKADFVQKNNFFATERSNLMMQVKSADSRLDSLENVKKVEMAQLVKDNESAKELLLLKHEEHVKELQEKAELEKQALKTALQDDHRRNLDRSLANEKKTMQEKFEDQLEALQKESHQMMGELEQALHTLKQEKLGISKNLEALQQKLEDTEDSLFDTQKGLVNKQKELSLFTWQAMTKAFNTKKKFMKALDDFDANRQQQIDSLTREAKNKYIDLLSQYLKCSYYIYDFEQKRRQTIENIGNYKPGELKRLKKKIQSLEREIEQLTLEKESYDSSRQILLQEIENLLQEVREQEELVKEHQQESAMTINGRINLAFARKKRRLDAEIEKLLEQIEYKRQQVQEMDDKIMEKHKYREDKENEMIDIERQLVSILVEQQRMTMKEVADFGSYADKAQFLSQVMRIPWPPPENPRRDEIEIIITNQTKLDEDK